MNDAISRFAIVRQHFPVEFRDSVLVESWSNDTWVNEELVLRVCWRGDRERLLREHELLTTLPISVPHASAVASGRIADLTWMLLRRIQGERLDLVWPSLSIDARRDAVVSLGNVLSNLHDWVPPPNIRKMLLHSTLTVPASRDAVVGSTIVPLPLERVALLLDCLESFPGMSEELLRRVRMRIDSLGSVISASELEDGLVIHGDAHFANALWFEGCLVALLDFEWARIGPSDLELEAACREDPIIEDAAESGPIPASEVPMLVWLRAGYPELFIRENLTERLWLYELCHQVRQLSGTGIVSLNQLQLKRLNILAAGPRIRFA
jgi:aminoglycoside phosphotransferase (APT) family kinase protein